MMRATDAWTAADLDETPIAETASLGTVVTASVIVIVPITRTIIGDDDTLRIGEIQTSIRDTGLTDGDTKTSSVFDPRVAVGSSAVS